MKIYWDSQEHKLVPGLRGGTVTRKIMALRDVIPIELYYLTPQENFTTPYVQGEIPAGTAIRFGVKATDDLDATTFLVWQPTWTKQGSGTTAYYTADVNLNTTELIAEVGEVVTDLTAEFALEDTASGQHQETTQFELRVLPDVIRNTEAGPVAISVLLVPFTDDKGNKCTRMMNEDGVTLGIWKPPGA